MKFNKAEIIVKIENKIEADTQAYNKQIEEKIEARKQSIDGWFGDTLPKLESFAASVTLACRDAKKSKKPLTRDAMQKLWRSAFGSSRDSRYYNFVDYGVYDVHSAKDLTPRTNADHSLNRLASLLRSTSDEIVSTSGIADLGFDVKSFI